MNYAPKITALIVAAALLLPADAILNAARAEMIEFKVKIPVRVGYLHRDIRSYCAVCYLQVGTMSSRPLQSACEDVNPSPSNPTFEKTIEMTLRFQKREDLMYPVIASALSEWRATQRAEDIRVRCGLGLSTLPASDSVDDFRDFSRRSTFYPEKPSVDPRRYMAVGKTTSVVKIDIEDLDKAMTFE